MCDPLRSIVNHANKSLRLLYLRATLTSSPLEEQLIGTAIVHIDTARHGVNHYLNIALGIRPLMRVICLVILPPSKYLVSFLIRGSKTRPSHYMSTLWIPRVDWVYKLPSSMASLEQVLSMSCLDHVSLVGLERP